jgi:hypothetical protein
MKSDSIQGHEPTRVPVASGAGRVVCSCGWTSGVQDDGSTFSESYDAMKDWKVHAGLTSSGNGTPARQKDFLIKLAELCDSYRAGFRYTTDDDGIHIDVDGVDVFVGFIEEPNAGSILREAARRL